MKKLILLLAVAIHLAGTAQINPVYNWAHSLANTVPLGGNLEVRALKADASGNTYVLVKLENTGDFDPGAGILNLTSAGSYDIALAKYNSSGSLVFAHRIGSTSIDEPQHLVLDASGNIFITGSFQNTVDFDPGSGTANLVSAGSADIFVAKYDASGNYQMAFAIGAAAAETAYRIALDASGNIYLSGFFNGTTDFDPGSGTVSVTSTASGYDLFLARYDASGNYIYSSVIAGSSIEYCYGLGIDASGNAYLAGTIQGTADFDPGSGTANLTIAGGSDIYLAKYDASGNYLWAESIGGTGYETPLDMVMDASDNMYITGQFSAITDFNPGAGIANLTPVGNSDVFVAKYNSSGTYQWAFKIGSTTYDSGNGIALDASANVYVTGTFTGTTDFDPGAATVNLNTAGTQDIYIAKYNTSGTYQMAKAMGGTSYDGGDKLDVDASGNIYVAGYFTGTADFDPGSGTANLTASTVYKSLFVGQYSTTGSYSWAIMLGGYGSAALPDEGRHITTDAAGNVYVYGTFQGTVDFNPGSGTNNLTSAGNMDMFLAKYDAAGNYLWAFSLGSTNSEYAENINIDATGNIILSGFFFQALDFNPGAGNTTLTSAGSNDIFVAKYDASGNFLFAFNVGGTGSDVCSAAGVDASGNIYITGTFSGVVDFNPGSGTSNLSAANVLNMYLAKYDASGNYLNAYSMTSSTGYAIPTSLEINSVGHLYISGTVIGDVDFDPYTSVMQLPASSTDDIFLAKYLSGGQCVFVKALTGADGVQADDLAFDASGNVYITGSFYGTLDADPGAATALQVSALNYNILLAKYNSSGNYLWAFNIGGTNNDYGRSVVVDAANNVLLAGNMYGTVDFDPGSGVANITSAGSIDMFMAKYDANGNYLTANKMGGTGDDYTYSIATGPGNQVYLTGSFTNSADFDIGSGVQTLTAYNYSDVFFTSYTDPNYTITVTSGGNGTASPLGPVIVAAGTNTTLTFTANSGYCVHQVVIDGVDNGPLASYTFTNVLANHTVTVSFLAAPLWYLDTDNDGYHTASVQSCTNPGAGYHINTTAYGDCDDNNPAVHASYPFYLDADLNGNGFGCAVYICAVNASSPPAGYSLNNLDGAATSVPATPVFHNGTALVCAGITYTYSVLPDPNATNYVWMIPAGSTLLSGLGTNSITCQFPATMITGAVRVKAKNCLGFSPEIALTVKKNSAAATPGVITGDKVVCIAEPYTYTVPAVANVTTYTWTAPANAFVLSGQGTNSVTIGYVAGFVSGNISVTAGNCVGTSAARTLAVSTTPGTPVITGPANNICSPTTGKVYTAIAIAGAASYDWVVTGGTIISGQGSLSITVDFPTVFTTATVKVRAVSSCGATGVYKTYSVAQRPATPANITGPVSACATTSNTYSIAPVAGAASYTWTVPSGWSIVSGQGTTSVVVTAGVSAGSISVKANNTCAASTAKSMALTINTGCRTAQPEASMEETESITENVTAKVYPNPFAEQFSIEFTSATNSGQTYLHLFDITGKLVKEQPIPTETGINRIEVSLNGEAPGVYVVALQQGRLVHHFRLVKE